MSVLRLYIETETQMHGLAGSDGNLAIMTFVLISSSLLGTKIGTLKLEAVSNWKAQGVRKSLATDYRVGETTELASWR